MSSPAQETPPVDWTQVKEEILCPLCDYNLRGLAEPRCPECGYRFAWRDMLDPDRKRHPYLFEHHPRHNVWSFFRTLRGGLKPRKFWTSLWPGQRSVPKRLFLYWLFVSSCLLLLLLSAIVSDSLGLARQQAASRAMLRERYQLALGNPAAGYAASFFAVVPRNQAAFNRWLDAQYPMPPSAGFFRLLYAQWDITRNSRYAVERLAGIVLICLPVLIWPWLTFLALLVFQSSMFRAKVRTIHVIRCIVYSADVEFWFCVAALLLSLAASALVLALGGNPADWGPDQFLPWLLLLGAGVFIYRMAIAYKNYLKFDWPIATILASQIVALLLASNLLWWSFWCFSRW